MKLKRLSLLITLVIISIFGAQSQPISPVFFGQNAWMPDTIGSKIYYGKFYSKLGDVKASGAQIVRYGGIAPDQNKPTNYQYIRIIDSLRARGIEPVLQVPFHKGQYTASQAADIVRYVNITKGKKIKYWVIGNEPDLGYSYNASQIAAYTKSYASAMKAVDPTIKTIGPECAWYNHTIMNTLTNPGGPDDITGKDGAGRFYIDIISFHTYPFNGTQTRSQVITKLMESYSLDHNLSILNGRLATAHSYHGRTASPIKVAITEANVNYLNSASDNLYGVGANSFIGGQFWAEMCGISLKRGVEFINFWSVLEGNSNELNIGYLDRTTGAKKPTFYHFQMMSQNIKGSYVEATDNLANVKAFGSKSGSQVAVMVMNQDQSANLNFTTRLDKSAVSGTNALKLNVNAGIAKEYSGTIAAQSTQMLIFDLSGNLTKKIEYKLYGHADANLPPTVTNYTVSTTTLAATITPATSTTFCAGGSVLLKGNTGSGYTYQWRKDGVDITGATAADFTAIQTGSYQLKVTSGTQIAWSAPLQVTVTAAPIATITASGSTTISSGQSVTLTANSGTGLTYQWKKDGVNISGATAISYAASASGKYSVTVKNAGGCTTNSASTTVTLSTTTLTATVTPASSTTFCAGGNVVLNGNTGSGYIYKWKRNGVDIPGATYASYTATTTGSYVLKITSGTQSAYSPKVSVTVNSLPSATVTASGSTTVASGQTVTLTANSGTGFTYQWRKDGVNISGATAISFKASATGNYSVIVKNTNGCSKTSADTKITVGSTTTLSATTSPSGTVTITSGGSVTIYASTGINYTYQWKKDGVNISGATYKYYTAKSAGKYQVKITANGAVAYSSLITVVIGTVASRSSDSLATSNEVTTETASKETFKVAGNMNQKQVKRAFLDSLAKVAITARSKEEESRLVTSGKGGAEAHAEAEAQAEVMAEGDAEILFVDSVFSVKAFPNPTNGPLNLQFYNPSGLPLMVEVQVISLTGQLILNRKFDLQEQLRSDVLDLNGMASGTYFLKITQSQKVENIKFIITR